MFKYLIPYIPKGGISAKNPDAVSHNWSYDVLPLKATHEVMRLSKEVRLNLPQIGCPALIVQGALDPDLDPGCAQIVYDGVRSKEKEILILNNSSHVLTIDFEWEQLAEKTYQFIRTHVPEELLN